MHSAPTPAPSACEWREPFVGGGSIFFASPFSGFTCKSPLRYPGGKSKKAREILQYVPPTCALPTAYWINDKHAMLVAFYQELQRDVNAFIERCRSLENTLETFERLAFADDYPWQGTRFFFLNRTIWGGRVNPALPSRMRYTKPEGWTLETLIPRLRKAAEKLQQVRITALDFEEVIQAPGENVFLYCDPPYVADTFAGSTSKLYQHSFTLEDHRRLAEVLRQTPHRFLLSYDDNPLVYELYGSWCRIEKIPWVNQGSSLAVKKRVHELVIMNYQ